MNKILLGAILVSSLAISGDLAKCSHAIDMEKKYIHLSFDAYIKDDLVIEGVKIADQKKKSEVYGKLSKLWKKEAIKECVGVISKEELKHLIAD